VTNDPKALPTRSGGLYETLRDRFGGASPKASGYRFAFSFFRERRLVLDAVGDTPGAALDLGCGVGLVSDPLVGRARIVLGIDASALACGEAARRGIAAVRADALRLPIADGTVDTTLVVGFLQELEPDALPALVAEAGRVLRPGGIAVMAWRDGRSWMHRLARAAFVPVDRLSGRPPALLHHHAPERVVALAEDAGLRPERVASIFPPLSWQSLELESAGARLLGTGFLAVFRREPDDGRPGVPDQSRA